MVESKQSFNLRMDLIAFLEKYNVYINKLIHNLNPEITVWQRSFHDHVIRNRHSYEKIWMYIVNNPAKWEEDCFFCRQSVTEEREG